MQVEPRKEIMAILNQLYDTSEEFTKERGVGSREGKSKYTISVAPLHKLVGREPSFFTMEELNTFYDNYSYAQVDEMVVTSQFPMKLISLWNHKGKTKVGFESEPDGNILIPLSEVIELFEEDYRKFLES